MTIEQIAAMAHAANRELCLSMGDFSQQPWSMAPDWQKESAISGVKFHLDNPDAKPSQGHEKWLKDKSADGWVYGPVKDAYKKQHPCMVPYDELPPSQQAKDHLFTGIVNSMRKYIDH